MRSHAFAVLLSLVALCEGACSGPPPQTPDSDGQPQPPFPCHTDAECIAPSCGPCTSGTVLLQQSRACAVNPCPGIAVACSAQKVCVVK